MKIPSINLSFSYISVSFGQSVCGYGTQTCCGTYSLQKITFWITFSLIKHCPESLPANSQV